MNVNMGNQNGIGQGFANLAKVFAPNSSDLINADVARQRVAADRSNAETSRMNAVTSRNADNRKGEIHDNLMGVGGVLAGLSSEMDTPEGRARVAGALAAAGLDLKPADLVGILTAVQPDTYSNGDFSRVLSGSTGMAWGNTPQGAREAEVANTERKVIEAAGKANDVPAVTSIDLQRISPQIGRALKEIAGVSPTQEAVGKVAARASEIFQRTENWSTAIQEAIKSFDYDTEGYGWYNPWENKFNVTPNGYEPQTGAGTPPATGAGTPPAGVDGLPDPSNLPEGQRLQDNATGEITHVIKDGQWVPTQ